MAYYHFDGNTNYASGNSNDGTIVGDLEWIGAIEEFNIYNVALIEEQVAINYAAGFIK